MSGLYNMLCGKNPAAPHLFGILGITQQTAEQWPVGRIRDVYTNEDGTKIFIFTRNGPSGMGLTEEERDAIEKNFRENHPHYVGFEIDDFDCTYLTYEFNTPKDRLDIAKEIAEMTETDPPMVRMKRLLDDMKAGKENPAVKNAMEAGKKMLGPILQSLDAADGGNIDEVIEHGDGAVEIFNFPKDE